MPWHVEEGGGTCSADEWAVIKDSDGSTAGCHGSKAEAEDQVAALYANEDEGKSTDMAGELRFEAPREDLVRLAPPVSDRQRVVLRARNTDSGGDERPVMQGYAAVFNVDTVIDSWEGRFIERLAPGTFRKTLQQRGDQVKVLFNHGMDPMIGDKPLGKPSRQEEDDTGLWVEVPLDDTSYNRDIEASLRSGALDGMSFRMSVVRDEWEWDKDDPDSLPIRTIREVKLYEYGPVTFPAYEATQAGIRAHAPRAYELYRSAQGKSATVVPAPADKATQDESKPADEPEKRTEDASLEPEPPSRQHPKRDIGAVLSFMDEVVDRTHQVDPEDAVRIARYERARVREDNKGGS